MRLDQSSPEISALIDKIQSGELDLQPDFQRGNIWPDHKKRRLIDTILREWYVPAIHIVVNDVLDKEEVLDGQQRLRAILEFMTDEFPVEGGLPPTDDKIVRLDGLRYSELPKEVRSKFRRFTIQTVRLREYLPEEPGELFFRLNQLSPLTAAEQRNALFGAPRNQIRGLSSELEGRLGNHKIGFTNSRMNFDDTLSRLAATLEVDRLDAKLTAGRLEERYRSGKKFSEKTVGKIRQSIQVLAEAINFDVRLNKASLFSWLYFLADNDWATHPANADFFRCFFVGFEAARGSGSVVAQLFMDESYEYVFRRLSDEGPCRECITIFNDRSSSRVNDVSSVLLRDLCINVCVFFVAPGTVRSEQPLVLRGQFLDYALHVLAQLPADIAHRSQIETQLIKQWESHRAIS